MPADQDVDRDTFERPGHALGDAVLQNGVDVSAERRTHMRRLTMARQAAERLNDRPGLQTGLDRPARLEAARERGETLRVELARIDEEHWNWLRDQGVSVPDRRTRRRTAEGAEQPESLLAPA